MVFVPCSSLVSFSCGANGTDQDSWLIQLPLLHVIGFGAGIFVVGCLLSALVTVCVMRTNRRQCMPINPGVLGMVSVSERSIEFSGYLNVSHRRNTDAEATFSPNSGDEGGMTAIQAETNLWTSRTKLQHLPQGTGRAVRDNIHESEEEIEQRSPNKLAFRPESTMYDTPLDPNYATDGWAVRDNIHESEEEVEQRSRYPDKLEFKPESTMYDSPLDPNYKIPDEELYSTV